MSAFYNLQWVGPVPGCDLVVGSTCGVVLPARQLYVAVLSWGVDFDLSGILTDGAFDLRAVECFTHACINVQLHNAVAWT
jgi:hypothetical protein